MDALRDFEKSWLADKDVASKLVVSSSPSRDLTASRLMLTDVPQTELCIDPTAYGTRWYLTLFNLSIPFPAQLRVWDVFMLLGESIPEPSPSSPRIGGGGERKKGATTASTECGLDAPRYQHGANASAPRSPVGL